MTVQSPAQRRLELKPWMIPSAVVAALAAFVAVTTPDWSVLDELSPVIKIHLAAAVCAFVLGVVMMSSRKGRTFHRRAGWLWVGLMSVVAGSSIFITGVNGSSWSFIHIFTGLTLIGLPLGVVAARRHDVKKHRAQMMGLFYGGMVVAGGFTFLPGRVMWNLFFG